MKLKKGLKPLDKIEQVVLQKLPENVWKGEPVIVEKQTELSVVEQYKDVSVKDMMDHIANEIG